MKRVLRLIEEVITAYLRYVIERIAKHPINRIEEFLPWNLADALRTETRRHLAA